MTPSESILAEPTVSVVDKVVEKKDTKAVAEAYLKYLYSPEGQEIAAKTTIVHVMQKSRRNTKTHFRS